MNTKPARCFVELFAFIRDPDPDGCRGRAPPTAASILDRIEEVKKLIEDFGQSWRGVRGAALG
jgi:hypothetical protein